MDEFHKLITDAIYKARWVDGMKTIVTDADIAEAVIQAIWDVE